mgnify:CR=1 FL=1
MIRRPPGSTQSRASAASDVYKRQIETMEELNLAARAREIEAILRADLEKLAATYPQVGEIRGRGAMIAM